MNTCRAKQKTKHNNTDQTKIYQIPHKNSKSEWLQYSFICQSPHTHLPATRVLVWMSITLSVNAPPPPTHPPTKTAIVQMSSISVHLLTPPPPLNTHIQFKRQLNTHNKSANVQNLHLNSHHNCRPSDRRRQAISRTECMLYFTDNYNNNNHNNKCISKMLNLSMLRVWGSKHYTWNTTTAHDLI